MADNDSVNISESGGGVAHAPTAVPGAVNAASASINALKAEEEARDHEQLRSELVKGLKELQQPTVQEKAFDAAKHLLHGAGDAGAGSGEVEVAVSGAAAEPGDEAVYEASIDVDHDVVEVVAEIDAPADVVHEPQETS